MAALWLQLLFYGLLGFVCLFYLVLFIFTCLRYRCQPLPFRSPPLLLLTLLGLALSSIWVSLFLVFDSDGIEAHYDIICDQWDWVLWSADLCIVLPYALRAYRIFRIFTSRSPPPSSSTTLGSLNGNSPHHAPLTPTSHSPPTVISSLHLLLVFALTFLLLSLLKLTLNLLHISTSHGFGCAGSTTEVWELIGLAETLLLLLAIRRLKQVRQEIRDDYGMMREYSLVGVVWVLYWLATVGLGVIREGSLVHRWSGVSFTISLELYRYIHTPVTLLRNLLLTLVTSLYPLHLSYHHTFTPLWSSPDSLLSLDSLLKDIICIQYYRQYLLSIQHVEWVLAWVEIELFKDMLDPFGAASDTLTPPSHSSSSILSDAPPPRRRYTAKQQAMINEEAHRIYDKYLIPSAPMYVHVSALTLQRIGRELGGAQGVGGECFDDVQAELYGKMNSEFARFLSSPLCEQCLQELEREEQLRDTLEKSGMI